MFSTKTGAARLSIISNSTLIALKIGVGLSMGSLSVISEALHSLSDLAAAAVAFFGLRVASRPADLEHPYGHGKAEGISALLEAVLLLVAVVVIFNGAVGRFARGGEMVRLEIGMGVMAFSMLANFLVSRHLYRVARATDSIALEADAKHLSADIWTSLGVLAGLGAVRLTGLQVLDPIIAMGVALLIIRAAYEVGKKSFTGLMDVRLPRAEEQVIEATILEHSTELVGFHQLRTRKVGGERHIELHLVMAPEATLEQAHRLTEHLEQDIRARLPGATLTIHMEPPEEI